MKKYVLTLLAAAATFAACTKFVEDPKIEYATIEAPEVTATTASDNSIVVTIAPKEGTTFYSYVVAKGVAKPVDAKALLQGKSGLTPVTIEDKEYAEVVEIVPASKASSTATIDQVKSLTIEGLIPYTYYTVYAVATNAQGVISDVATASTLTTDSTAPSIKNYDTEEADSVMYYQILFNDPIKLSGEGDLTLHIYGENYCDNTTLNCIEIKNVVIAPENISDEGGVITVKIPKDYYIPGAIVDLTWPEGFVKNAQDMPCAAFPYTGLYYDAAHEYALTPNGISAQYEYVDFALSFFATAEEEEAFLEAQEDEEEIVPETVYYSDWQALQMVAYARTDAPLASTKTAKASVSVSDAAGRVVSYPVTPGMTQEGNIAVALGENPGFGTVATYTIEAGSYVDIFGNENLEYSLDYGTYFCSYGYSINDVVGTYNVTGSEYDFSSDKPIAFEPKTLTIVKSDDSEKGNVMITNYFGIPCIKPVYADFDVDAGKLTIFEWQVFYARLYQGGDTPDDESDDAVAYYYHSSNNGEDLVLNMYESGVLSNPSDSFGAYLYISKEMQGYNFMLVDVTATKVSESEGPTATPATIPFEFPSNAKRTMKPVIKL